MAQIYDYDIVLESGKHITQDGGTVANSSSLAPEYDSTATYAVGDLCTHLGSLYSCSTAIGTAEEWDAAHWTETTIAENLGGGSAPMVEITWSELKALRDGGQLIPGMQYRITDFVTMTNPTFSGSSYTSAHHQFDLIVTANTSSSLHRVARAALHDGDTYFIPTSDTSYIDLSKWIIWYDLDNAGYDWSDITNGKGVIYRMIDEKGNDLPYDFKNIIFRYYTPSGYTWKYTFAKDFDVWSNLTDNSLSIYVYGNSVGPYIEGRRRILNQMLFVSGANNNHIGNKCKTIYFKSSANDNNIGNKCSAISFGIGGIAGINIGNNCSYINAGASTSDICIKDNCSYINFGTDSSTLSSYYYLVIIDEYCSHINLYSNDSPSSSNYLTNIHIHSGIQGKDIVVPRKLDHMVDYYPINSVREEI